MCNVLRTQGRREREARAACVLVNRNAHFASYGALLYDKEKHIIESHRVPNVVNDGTMIQMELLFGIITGCLGSIIYLLFWYSSAFIIFQRFENHKKLFLKNIICTTFPVTIIVILVMATDNYSNEKFILTVSAVILVSVALSLCSLVSDIKTNTYAFTTIIDVICGAFSGFAACVIGLDYFGVLEDGEIYGIFKGLFMGLFVLPAAIISGGIAGFVVSRMAAMRLGVIKNNLPQK